MSHAGKVVRLRQKLSDITGAVSGIFGRKAEKDPAVARLDALKVRNHPPRGSRKDHQDHWHPAPSARRRTGGSGVVSKSVCLIVPIHGFQGPDLVSSPSLPAVENKVAVENIVGDMMARECR